MKQFVINLGAGGGTAITPQPPVSLRVAFFNTYLSIGTVGSVKYNAIKSSYARVDADVAIVDETPSSAWALVQSNLAPELSYTYTARGANVSLGNAVMSKYALSNVQWLNDAYNQAQGYTDGTEWAGSSTGAFRCSITKEGQLFIVYGVHLKFTSGAWNPSVPVPADEFMRWCQTQVILKDVAAQQAANPAACIVVIGDYNDGKLNTQTATFGSKPSGSYGSFAQDSSLYGFSYPITYGGGVNGFPFDQLNATAYPINETFNLDADNISLWANDPNAAVTVPVSLDHVASNATTVASEYLDSEATQTGGLTKYGSALGFDVSRDASDHKLIFADINV